MKPDEGIHLIFRQFLGSIYRLHSNHWHIVDIAARVEPHSKTRKTNKAGNYIYCGTFALGAEWAKTHFDWFSDRSQWCMHNSAREHCVMHSPPPVHYTWCTRKNLMTRFHYNTHILSQKKQQHWNRSSDFHNLVNAHNKHSFHTQITLRYEG